MTDTPKAYRYWTAVPVSTEVQEALNLIKERVEKLQLQYAMGSLAWHDKYWMDQTQGSLPGAFWVPLADFFDRPRIEHLFQAVFFNRHRQVRLWRRPDHFHLALLQDEPLDDAEAENGTWQPVPGELTAGEIHQLFLVGESDGDREKRHAFATQQGAFNEAFKDFHEEREKQEPSYLCLATYRSQGQVVDWRFTYDASLQEGE